MSVASVKGLATSVASLSTPRRKKRTHHRMAIFGFMAPFLVLFALFYLVPVGFAIAQSFLRISRDSIYAPPTLVFAGFEQYVTVFQSGPFWSSLGRVGLLLGVQVPFTILLGLIFALLIDSKVLKGRRFFRLAFFVPYAVPGVIAAIMWGFVYAPSLSPLPGLFTTLDLLGSGNVIWGLANILVWTVAGFNMLISYSALQAIPQELYEAAIIDGAGELRIAWSIKIPLIVPALIMTGIFAIIGAFQLFGEPTVLQELARTLGADFTPNMLVYATSSIPNYNLAAAFSVVLAIGTCIVSFLFLRLTQRRAFA